MSTELEQLRAFRASDAAPDPDARAVARVALLERIDAAATAAAPIAPPTAVRRSRRRLLAGALGLASAAAAAIALVAGLGSGPIRPADATAAQVLRHAAVVAAQQPDVVLKPGEYWYSRSETRQPGDDDARFVREDWGSLAGDGRFVTRRMPNGPVEEHAFEGRLSFGFVPQPLTYDQMLALPTETDALYAVIERAGTIWATDNGRPVGDRTHEMFTIVGDWLRATPTLPSALRAALYRVAARLPDVESLGDVRDTQGRAGVGVAQTGDGQRRELVFDPQTARLLMERTVRADSGALVYEATYVASGVVDSPQARP